MDIDVKILIINMLRWDLLRWCCTIGLYFCSFNIYTQVTSRDIFTSYFSLIFGRYRSFLWGHWYPSFTLLVTSTLGCKTRVDPLLVYPLPVWNGVLRFTSGGTPADLLTASIAAESFWPTTCKSWINKHWWDSNPWPTELAAAQRS